MKRCLQPALFSKAEGKPQLDHRLKSAVRTPKYKKKNSVPISAHSHEIYRKSRHSETPPLSPRANNIQSAVARWAIIPQDRQVTGLLGRMHVPCQTSACSSNSTPSTASSPSDRRSTPTPANKRHTQRYYTSGKACSRDLRVASREMLLLLLMMIMWSPDTGLLLTALLVFTLWAVPCFSLADTSSKSSLS